MYRATLIAFLVFILSPEEILAADILHAASAAPVVEPARCHGADPLGHRPITADGDVLAAIELPEGEERTLSGYVCNALDGSSLSLRDFELIKIREWPDNEEGIVRRRDLSTGAAEELDRILVEVRPNGAFRVPNLAPGIYVFKIDWTKATPVTSWVFYCHLSPLDGLPTAP